MEYLKPDEVKAALALAQFATHATAPFQQLRRHCDRIKTT